MQQTFHFSFIKTMISTCNNRIIDLFIVALMCPISFEWTCMLPTWQFSHKIPNSILKHGIYKPCYFGAGTLLNGTPLNRPPPTIYQKKFDMLCHLDDIEKKSTSSQPGLNGSHMPNIQTHSFIWPHYTETMMKFYLVTKYEQIFAYQKECHSAKIHLIVTIRNFKTL